MSNEQGKRHEGHPTIIEGCCISSAITICDYVEMRKQKEVPDEKNMTMSETTSSLSPHQINSLLPGLGFVFSLSNPC